MQWLPIEQLPEDIGVKDFVVCILWAGKYGDKQVVWKGTQPDKYHRWPYTIPPTHFCLLPE